MDILISFIAWLTGICSITVFFPLTLIIWLVVLPFDRNRNIIHFMLVYQSIFLMKLIPVWKVTIEGREKAEKRTTYVIISNHQSILDILLLNGLRYRFKWISKIENIKVPLLGWYIRMAGYITVDRGNSESKEQMMARSYRYLSGGISIMIFPEGTRSVSKDIGFFRRGAFQMAVEANVPILPVLIDGTGDILPKHGLVFGKGYHVRIKVFDPVSPSRYSDCTPEELASELNAFMVKEMKSMRNSSDKG
jgi:1-acyl-sn-glycerol-3-phosphate acyltransferase